MNASDVHILLEHLVAFTRCGSSFIKLWVAAGGHQAIKQRTTTRHRAPTLPLPGGQSGALSFAQAGQATQRQRSAQGSHLRRCAQPGLAVRSQLQLQRQIRKELALPAHLAPIRAKQPSRIGSRTREMRLRAGIGGARRALRKISPILVHDGACGDEECRRGAFAPGGHGGRRQCGDVVTRWRDARLEDTTISTISRTVRPQRRPAAAPYCQASL